MQEMKLFWELYSHGQFIYNKIDKTVKVIFNLCDELPDVKKAIVYKAVCDLCKECQPDLPLVEVTARDGAERVDSDREGTGVRDVQSDGVRSVGIRV